MTALAAIAELLRARIGLDPATLGARALAHAVRGRVAARGLDGPSAYLAALADDPAEWTTLLEAVVVPETWFFRDRHPFVLLGRWAADAWAQRNGADPVALLSLPCATGEEAWSIAIVLAAAGLPPAAFRVEARDLSPRALAVARAGVYSQRALRGKRLDPVWASYLRACPDGRLAVAPELRASVHFASGNLVDARRDLDGRRFDCVFSRNLLIYCDAATRAAAIATFAALLRPDGLLVLGHAETLPPRTPGFVREGTPGAFAWRRADTTPAPQPNPRRGRVAADLLPACRDRERPQGPPLPKAGRVARPGRAVKSPMDALRQARGERKSSMKPGRESVRAEPVEARAGATELTHARVLADAGRLYDAAALAAARLASAPDDVDAHVLLGIVRAAQGHDDTALEHLRRALYLDPVNEEALVHLALVLERRGERAAAARLRQRARRVEAAR